MTIRMTGLMSGLDTDSIIKELMSAQSLKKTKIENKKTKLEWKQEKWKELNTKIYSLYTKQVSKMKLQGSYLTKKVTSSNENLVTATATSSAATGSHKLEIKELASSQYVTGAAIKDKNDETVSSSSKLVDAMGMTEGTIIEVGSGTNKVELEIKEDTTISDVVKKMQEAGLNASFDSKQGRFFISSKESGVENAFTLRAYTKDEAGAEQNNNDLNKLGLINITDTNALQDGTVDIDGDNNTTSDLVSIVSAKDAKIILDGAELTDSSNSFTVAGMTLELKGKTTEAITLNASNDVDAVYDAFKDFITEYNKVLKEMNELYNAESSKGYDPLTDEQKEAMSEDEIEKWENKIKDSLLRRDTTLNSVTNAMKSALQSTVTIDGKTYSLSTYGVMTSSDYTEKGLLHIYGDEDDEDYSSETNKLKAALQEDPEMVAKVLSGIVSNLSDTLMDKMKTTSISSALTFYNDKEMKSQLEDYEDEIERWEERLSNMEDRYYNQFSAMEVALSKLNSQSSYLSSLMGTSS